MENQCRSHSAHAERLRTGELRMSKHAQEIDDLQSCVVRLTEIVETDREWRKEADQRLKVLESAPGKKWEHVTNNIMIALVAAIVGFVLGNFGL